MAKDKILENYREQLLHDEKLLKDYEAGTREEFDITDTGRANITAKAVATTKQRIVKLKGIISTHEKRVKHG